MSTGEQKWRLPITGSLTIFGVILTGVGVAALLIAGPASQYIITTIAGLALIFYFAPQAAGARRAKVGTDLVKAETDYTAPPPPHQRRIYLPKGWRSNSKRK